MTAQIKRIKNWDELLVFIENTNTFKNTIVLSGYFNYIDEDRLKISELLFTVKPVSILVEKSSKKKVKKNVKQVDKSA